MNASNDKYSDMSLREYAAAEAMNDEHKTTLAALMAKLESAQAINRERADAQTAAIEAEREVGELAREARAIIGDIKNVERQLKTLNDEWRSASAAREKADANARDLRQIANEMPTVECQPVIDRINKPEAEA